MSKNENPFEDNPIVAYFVSLGCAKNLVDAEVMCGSLAANGILLTTEQNEADITIVNTCSFIQDARKEAETAISQAIKWRNNGRRKGILRAVAVAGCLPQRDPEGCARQYPDVDFFLGLDDVPRIHQLVIDYFKRPDNPATRFIPAVSLPTYLYDHDTPRITVTPEAYAYVKIAEGCDHRCAFCAIPAIRGHLRSRSCQSVLTECQQLLDQGVKELNFIAQDTTSFGLENKAGDNLVKLLKECEKLPGDFWIRILYTHPYHITEEFLDILAHGTHLVPYLDMPLQHINDEVLKNMKRRMSGADTRRLVEHIRSDYPNLCLRTTLLTGFPGETQEAYEELRDFVTQIRFDRLGVFSFSPEEGTPAALLTEGIVPPRVASQRRNELLSLQKPIVRQLNTAKVGQVLPVLVEEQLGAKNYLARSTDDAPEVDQHITLQVKDGRKHYLNSFVTARITGYSDYDLTAILE